MEFANYTGSLTDHHCLRNTSTIRIAFEVDQFPRDCHPPRFRDCNDAAVERFQYLVRGLWPNEKLEYIAVGTEYCNQTILKAVGNGLLHTRVHLFAMLPTLWSQLFYTPPILSTRVSFFYQDEPNNEPTLMSIVLSVLKPMTIPIWCIYLVVHALEITVKYVNDHRDYHFLSYADNDGSHRLRGFWTTLFVIEVFLQCMDRWYGANSAAVKLSPPRAVPKFLTVADLADALDSGRYRVMVSHTVRFEMIEHQLQLGNDPAKLRLRAIIVRLMEAGKIEIPHKLSHQQLCEAFLRTHRTLLIMWLLDKVIECKTVPNVGQIREAPVSPVIMNKVYGGFGFPRALEGNRLAAERVNLIAMAARGFMIDYRVRFRPLFSPQLIALTSERQNQNHVFGSLIILLGGLFVASLGFIVEWLMPY